MSGWQPIATAPKDGAVAVPLTLGKVAIIDVADLSLIARHTWHARPRRDRRTYYAVNASGIRMHRLLLGVWDKRVVDHIDGDGLNNRRRNLRAGTQSQNCVNRKQTPGKYLRGTRPKKGKWQSYIKYAGRQRSLGYFATEIEAHEAYLVEAKRLHGVWMPLPPPPPEQIAESANCSDHSANAGRMVPDDDPGAPIDECPDFTISNGSAPAPNKAGADRS